MSDQNGSETNDGLLRRIRLMGEGCEGDCCGDARPMIIEALAWLAAGAVGWVALMLSARA